MKRFDQRVVIITGAGSGLGRAAAVRLAEEGASLVLVDISADGLRGTTAEVAKVASAETIEVTADVSVEADVEGYVTAALDRFGRIDGFFNNAGIEGRPALTEDADIAEFDRVIAINLRGMLLGMRLVLAAMREQGVAGAIVNSASVGGIRGVGQQAAYAAAKHGVVGLTRNAAVEYAAFGIRVNAIAPGAIWTAMIENVMNAINPDDPEAAAAEFVKSNPTGRFGRADEVAAAVAFLLSDDATFVNGTVLPIDGGQSTKY